MFNGSNYDRKSQLSGILTEPLNPRVQDSFFAYIQYNHISNIKSYPVTLLFSRYSMIHDDKSSTLFLWRQVI